MAPGGDGHGDTDADYRARLVVRGWRETYMTARRFVKFRGAAYVWGLVAYVISIPGLAALTRLTVAEVIYFVTGLILLWYTIETWKLRHEMRRQTNMQSRPLLSVVFQGAGSETRALLQNVGLGPARSIRVRDVPLGSSTTTTLRGGFLPHLAREGAVPMPLGVFMGPAGEFPKADRDWKVASILKEGQHSVTITYGSLAGAWYETTIGFADGNTRIVTDEEIGVPEAEHR